MIKPKHKALLVGLVAVVAIATMAGTIYADTTAQPSTLQATDENTKAPMMPPEPTETPAVPSERQTSSADSAPTLPPASMPPVDSMPNINVSTATVDSSTVTPPQQTQAPSDVALEPVPFL